MEDYFHYEYAGVLWSAPRPDCITTVTVTMATFVDGGWFGSREAPPPGGALTREMLVNTHGDTVEPIIEYTTSPNPLATASWNRMSTSSDYVSRLTGHAIPSVPGAVTTRSFTSEMSFRLDTIM